MEPRSHPLISDSRLTRASQTMENDKRPVAAGAGARTSPSLGMISHMAEPIPARFRVATSITPLSHHVWVHQGYGAPGFGIPGPDDDMALPFLGIIS